MTTESSADLATLPFTDVRQAIRDNRYSGHTAGVCPTKLQCNLVILPASLAQDFESFCRLNTKTCPLISVSDVGDPLFENLEPNLDIRTDVPSYNIYKDGTLIDQVQDINAHWQDDFVSFAIGCSFTFERALIDAGIPMRHIDENLTVPMYQSNMELKSAGPFGGHAVVSMRPVRTDEVTKVFSICSDYPHAHGEPMHSGSADDIGIMDIHKPEWGNAVTIYDDEQPLFWGCGVTTQSAIMRAKPELCITHTPGCMLVTNIDELS